MEKTDVVSKRKKELETRIRILQEMVDTAKMELEMFEMYGE